MTIRLLTIVVWSVLCLHMLMGNKNATFFTVLMGGKLSTLSKMLKWNHLMIIDVSDDYKVFIALCLYWMHICAYILKVNIKATFCAVFYGYYDQFMLIDGNRCVWWLQTVQCIKFDLNGRSASLKCRVRVKAEVLKT